MPLSEGVPPIESLDDLIDLDELGQILNTKRSTINGWLVGKDGRRKELIHPLPFFRIARHKFVAKNQVIWWLNEYQKLPDHYYEDRMRRLKEGVPVGRKFTRNSA